MKKEHKQKQMFKKEKKLICEHTKKDRSYVESRMYITMSGWQKHMHNGVQEAEKSLHTKQCFRVFPIPIFTCVLFIFWELFVLNVYEENIWILVFSYGRHNSRHQQEKTKQHKKQKKRMRKRKLYKCTSEGVERARGNYKYGIL